MFSVIMLLILSIGCITMALLYRRAVTERNGAVARLHRLQQEQSLIHLQLAIIRFARDNNRPPRSMEELRGSVATNGDYYNPYTKRFECVIDATERGYEAPVPAHAITFRFIEREGPGSDRCAISIHDDHGVVRYSSLIQPPRLAA